MGGWAWFGLGRHRGLTHGRRGGHFQQDLSSVPGGSSPLAKLATAAIDLNNCRSQRGMVTMMSGEDMAEDTMTAEEKAKLEEESASMKAAIAKGRRMDKAP